MDARILYKVTPSGQKDQSQQNSPPPFGDTRQIPQNETTALRIRWTADLDDS